MKKNTINLLSGTILVFSIVLSGACKKVEVVDEKVGGCFDTDSPMHNGSVDYDDGTCQYAFVNSFELTKHASKKSNGDDWDFDLFQTNIIRPDVVLTLTNQLTSETLLQSTEIEDIDPGSAPSWSAPYEVQLFNQNYEWTLYDNDLLGSSELMAYGVFNPIELANNGVIRTGVANAADDSTVITLVYTLK